MTGYNKKYTSKLPTWKSKWWAFDRHGSPLPREVRKPWWEFQYYLERPQEADKRRKWEKLSKARGQKK